MKILHKILESNNDTYVISSIEKFNKHLLLLVFIDGSSVEISIKKGKYNIENVNKYNDNDNNMSTNFLNDVETVNINRDYSDYIKNILTDFKHK